MKKALFATTALVLSAGVAAADVTISGYGRTGVLYYDTDETGINWRGDEVSINNAQVESRLRMNIDASTSTDSGVDFGARFRLQWNQGQDSAQTNAAKLWVSASGVTVEVGNVDTAFDSTTLKGATELGVFDRSVGFSDVDGAYFAYESKAYNVDRVGARVVYSVDDLTVQGSFVDPDQSGLNENPFGSEEEFAVAVDYKWNDRLELSAAAAFNGAGYDSNDIYFIGARYAVNEQARVGLNFVDAGDEVLSYDANGDADKWGTGQTIALYGDYTLLDGLTNIEAYVAYNDGDRDRPEGRWKETNTAYGIGVNYDLGGARLGASLQRDYNKNTSADMGVRFDF